MAQRTRSEHTSLYRLYDSEDTLLYVGIAGNPGRRFEQHAEDKPWWSAVARVHLEHHATRDAAEAAEVAAIIAEKPIHNVAHNNGRAKPRLIKPGNQLTQGEHCRLDATDQDFRVNSLIGSWFHSFSTEDGDKVVKWQGCVVAEPAPGWYLVETFSWTSGESFTQWLVRIEDMADWDFYDSAKWMNDAYQRRLAKDLPERWPVT